MPPKLSNPPNLATLSLLFQDKGDEDDYDDDDDVMAEGEEPVMRPAGLLLALLPLSNSLLAAPARARRSATPVLRRAVPVGVATLPDAAAPIAPGAALTTFLASASATIRSMRVLLCGRGRVDRQGGC